MTKILLCFGLLITKIAVGQTINFDISRIENVWCIGKNANVQNFLLASGFKQIDSTILTDKSTSYRFQDKVNQISTVIEYKTLNENQITEFYIKSNNKNYINKLVSSLDIFGYARLQSASGSFLYYSKVVQFIGPKMKFVFSGKNDDGNIEVKFFMEYYKSYNGSN